MTESKYLKRWTRETHYIFKIGDIRKIEKIKLPKGYSIRQIKIKSGKLRKRHIEIFQKIWNDQSVTNRMIRMISRTTLESAIFFAKYKGEEVACSMVIVNSEDLAGIHFSCVQKEHRKKGLWKAMNAYRLQFYIDHHIKYMYASFVNKFQLSCLVRTFGGKVKIEGRAKDLNSFLS